MGRPFNIYTIISMYTEILFWSRATDISWMRNNPDGHLLKVLLVFRIQPSYYFVESPQKE